VWQDGAMRITIDIPDPPCREIIAKAAKEKRSVEELILECVETGLRSLPTKKKRRVTFPIIRSKHPGSLRVDNAEIFEVILFP
jgi:hypothetical protein